MITSEKITNNDYWLTDWWWFKMETNHFCFGVMGGNMKFHAFLFLYRKSWLPVEGKAEILLELILYTQKMDGCTDMVLILISDPCCSNCKFSSLNSIHVFPFHLAFYFSCSCSTMRCKLTPSRKKKGEGTLYSASLNVISIKWVLFTAFNRSSFSLNKSIIFLVRLLFCSA